MAAASFARAAGRRAASTFVPLAVTGAAVVAYDQRTLANAEKSVIKQIK
jgi:hypothetical protein